MYRYSNIQRVNVQKIWNYTKLRRRSGKLPIIYWFTKLHVVHLHALVIIRNIRTCMWNVITNYSVLHVIKCLIVDSLYCYS